MQRTSNVAPPASTLSELLENSIQTLSHAFDVRQRFRAHWGIRKQRESNNKKQDKITSNL